MSTLTVRNIASVIKGKLRLMGAAHGHSTQEEMRSHFASGRDADRQAQWFWQPYPCAFCCHGDVALPLPQSQAPPTVR